jgi:hypothetical protein
MERLSMLRRTVQTQFGIGQPIDWEESVENRGPSYS